MKKILTIVSIGVILTHSSLVTHQSTFAKSFPDVSPNSALENYVEYLTEKSIISGYPDGTFKPGQTINRAEALKLIFASIGKENPNTPHTPKKPFTDVPSDAWFTPYISQAKDSSIISGYPDGTFKPEQEVNRAEFIKMAIGALPFYRKNTAGNAMATDQYTDLDPEQWYIPYIAAGLQFNMLPKTDQLNPTGFMSRADAVEIIYNISKYGEEFPNAFNPETSSGFIPEEAFITLEEALQNKNRFPYNQPESFDIYRWNGDEFDFSTHVSNNEHGYIIGYGDPSPIIDASFQHNTLSIELEGGCFVDITEIRGYSSPEEYFQKKLDGTKKDYPIATSSILRELPTNDFEKKFEVKTEWKDQYSNPTVDHFIWFDAERDDIPGMEIFSDIVYRFHSYGPTKTEEECDEMELKTMNSFSKPLH